MIYFKNSKSFRIVIAGLLLCLGIILPFATSHAFGISGKIFLPMHIPVFLCGFLCGPLMGGLCGFLLPLINSLLTGMPALFPTALLVTVELLCYGFISGLLFEKLNFKSKVLKIYISLIIAMITGRIASGTAAWFMLLYGTKLFNYSIIASLVTGIPGIIIQLIIIPIIIIAFEKISFISDNAELLAIKMIMQKSANCVIVKNNTIKNAANQKGIKFLMEMHKQNCLKDSFVADSVVGKAAAMLMSLSGVKKCYADLISEPAYKWLKEQNIEVSYKKIVPFIINRDKTGVCPMEKTVYDINDHFTAYEALKEKLAQLR